MMIYEKITIHVLPGTQRRVLPELEVLLAARPDDGRLLGCWVSEIGALNQIIVLRGFTDIDSLNVARSAFLQSGLLPGLAACIQDINYRTWQGLSFLPDIAPGVYGNVYELRTYRVRPGCMEKVADGFRNMLPERSRLSVLLMAMYSLDGSLDFMHIWPYQGLDERARIRREAVETGVWPPPGSAGFLTENMHSQIVVPVSFSPLR